MPFDLPPVTRALLIANVAVYLLQMLTGDALLIAFRAVAARPVAATPTCPASSRGSSSRTASCTAA